MQNGIFPPKIQKGDVVRYMRLPHCPDMVVKHFSNDIVSRAHTDERMVGCFWFDKNWTAQTEYFHEDDLKIMSAVRAKEPERAPVAGERTTPPHVVQPSQVEPPCDVERSSER